MFSILQKPQESVNAEDLETLQNELERRLVEVVTRNWEIDRELLSLDSNSPDASGVSSKTPTPTITSSQPSVTNSDLKLRNSHKLTQSEVSENASDGFKGSQFNSNGQNGDQTSASNANSTEDSASSPGSPTSSLTTSTIITSVVNESGSHSQPPTANSLTNSNKRSHKGNNDRPSKRFRQNNSGFISASGPFAKRPPHSKHRSKILPSKFRNPAEESRPNKKQTPKNEAPDKLWPFVEQFCATPTDKQIEALEEMIQMMENDKDYFKVPVLGKKETAVKDSPTKSDNGKGQRKTKTRSGDEESGLGALTQRLVSSFIEENGDNGTDTNKSNEEGQTSKKKNSKNKGGKNLDMNNAKSLEQRIRQGLEEYDILDHQDEIPYTSEEDEILRELVASQHELLSIQNQNKESMQLLLRRARKHSELEAQREKLREANADVISSYHRLIQAKQRKRNPTKKEKDAAMKALKVHDAIFKKADEIYMSNLNR